MKTVTQLSRQTGISIRTLHHYDAIGLLRPTAVTEASYRLYDEKAEERLYLILLFRELGFPLKRIAGILDGPDYDRNRVLEQQVALLEEKRQHLANLTDLARGIQLLGVKHLQLEGFKVNKIDDYAAQAKTLYGKTDAYKEYEQKAKGRTRQQENALGDGVMALFARLGAIKDLPPESGEVQAWVKELQGYITEHFYTCTPQILLGLGQMYAGGGSMTENIDAAGGPGTGEFARQAIEIYCGK